MASGGGEPVDTLFCFQAVRALPAVDPVVQVVGIAAATAPDTEGLFVPFCRGHDQGPQIGDAPLAGKARVGASAETAAFDQTLFPALSVGGRRSAQPAAQLASPSPALVTFPFGPSGDRCHRLSLLGLLAAFLPTAGPGGTGESQRRLDQQRRIGRQRERGWLDGRTPKLAAAGPQPVGSVQRKRLPMSTAAAADQLPPGSGQRIDQHLRQQSRGRGGNPQQLLSFFAAGVAAPLPFDPAGGRVCIPENPCPAQPGRFAVGRTRGQPDALVDQGTGSRKDPRHCSKIETRERFLHHYFPVASLINAAVSTTVAAGSASPSTTLTNRSPP